MDYHYHLSLSLGVMHKPQILPKKVTGGWAQREEYEGNLPWTLLKILKIAAWRFCSCFLAFEYLPYCRAWIQKCGLTFLEGSAEYWMDITLFGPANFILLICSYRKRHCISPLAWLYFNSSKVNSLTTWNFLGILWCNKCYWNPSLEVLHKRPTLLHMKGFVCFDLFCFQ